MLVVSFFVVALKTDSGVLQAVSPQFSCFSRIGTRLGAFDGLRLGASGGRTPCERTIKHLLHPSKMQISPL